MPTTPTVAPQERKRNNLVVQRAWRGPSVVGANPVASVISMMMMKGKMRQEADAA